ncbi:antibiotic biosynthesis monooxygenase family protein [Bacillus sp. es.036]|uniref:antibiotic biosynthesis monooxygenase family protein n=1 Tax=Bacillus sp. es.036 TaxID=1761764 RepID=UPI000BF5AF92|nr:antibiotic biosynthesis monooxygenase family protein [Bacillus sp. es.036]PFG13298.1 antibiotic biosynthesis monooxygenase [Bacillus sp. es.036]
MVIEKAYFTIHEGLESTFEATFKEAVRYIAETAGYIHYRLLKSIESERKYVIFIEWETLASHTEGFMSSDRFEKFTSLVEPFLENVEMEHLTPVHSDL